MEGSTLGCFFKGKGCRFRTTNARVLDIRTMILQIDFLASTTANAVEDKSRRGKSRSMSGGTPVGGGFMRQRHSQGYASSGDDLEDDACSRQTPSSPAMPRARTWTEVMENILWIASAVFIIYYGDRNSNFIYLLLHDDRIRR
uniref:Uncharacterized protein n=1 Tax=Vitis vinifera TaxID=29760 RepID=A5BHH3_VITVI|nr:hypothetical protein VITISV_011674 [Vitis vinifera]